MLSSVRLGNRMCYKFTRRKYSKSAMFITDARSINLKLKPYLDYKHLDTDLSCRGYGDQVKNVQNSIKRLEKIHQDISDLNKIRYSLRDNLEAVNDLDRKKTCLSEEYEELEYQMIISLLNLPNSISEETRAQVIYSSTKEFSECNNTERKLQKINNHINIGLERKWLKVLPCDQQGYYLLGSLAELENKLIDYARNTLLNENFLQTFNPDFVPSVVIESCGEDAFSTAHKLALKSHQIYGNIETGLCKFLVGGSSLEACSCFFAMTALYPAALPIKTFTISKHFTRSENAFGLYDGCQQSTLEIFVVYKQYDLSELINLIKKFYEPLKLPYRLVQSPVDELHFLESARINVEVFSPMLQKYVVVGNISSFRDFLSKRLRIEDDKENSFPKIHRCTLISFKKVLAALIENRVDDIEPDNIFNF